MKKLKRVKFYADSNIDCYCLDTYLEGIIKVINTLSDENEKLKKEINSIKIWKSKVNRVI